jgi:predicted ATP-grasp superfamily ATP-dependent carboligase
MKTVKTTLVVLIVSIFGNLAFASGNLNVNFKKASADLTEVEISNTKVSNFEIELRDEFGDQLYKMKSVTPKNMLQKKYDFTGLDNGIYFYTVKIDKEKVTKTIEIKNDNVNVLNIRKSVEPYIAQAGETIKLSLLNPGNESIQLFVYDSSNQLLTEAKLGNEAAIHKMVDLSDLNKGSYSLVLANDVDIFEHNFSIQ